MMRNLLYLLLFVPLALFGQENYSLDFSSGNYGRIPTSDNLSNFETFTMEFWYFETGGHGSDENIVGTEYFAGNRYTFYTFSERFWPHISNGNDGVGLGYNGSNGSDGIPYQANAWCHLAVSYDGEIFRFFINGNLVYYDEGEIGAFGSISEDLVINRHTWSDGSSSSSRLTGQIDELRISNIARYSDNFIPQTEEFIPDEFTAGLWHFDNDFNDYSGNENHGIHFGTTFSENIPFDISNPNTLQVPSDYSTIQEAINASDDGDTILVSPGTYIENTTLNIINKQVNIISTNGPEETIISGDNSHRVIYIENPTDSEIAFNGFTVSNGIPGSDDHASAIKVESGKVIFNNLIIENNGSGSGNTVAYGSGTDNTYFIDCIIRNNSVENYAGLRSSTNLRCVLYGNNGWNNTCVLLDGYSENCVIYNNGGGYGSGLAGGNAVNCIFWNNSGNAGWNAESITFSDVQGGHEGEGNIDLDPLFVNAEQGDFSLQEGSPCIDAGDPNSDLDPDGSIADMGSFYFDQANVIANVSGCTDSLMFNYNVDANLDDDSCVPVIEGCIDSTAYNYDAVLNVNIDNGSCVTHEEFIIDSLQQALSVFETVSEEQDYSMSFDGVDDYVNVTSSSSIDSISSTFSISAWINPFYYSPDGSHPRIIHRTEGYGGTTERWFLTWCPNSDGWNAELQFGIGHGSNLVQMKSNSSIPLDEWTYVSVSFDDGNVYLYVNGVLEYTGISNYSSVEHVQGVDVRIASALNNSFFPGKINRLELWNQALNQEQIQNYMNCPPTGDEEGLVGFWNFNEGEGGVVTDLSGNGNHGEIHGATFSEDVPESHNGCTDESALNFDAEALCDNGSCVYGDDEYSNVVSSLDSTLLTLTDCNTEATTSLSSMQQALNTWNTTIDLDAGWNMFGYGCPEPIDVIDALSNYIEDILIVKNNNGDVYLPEYDFNGIGEFTSGYGYQVKVSQDIIGFSLCDWYVNDIPEDNILSLQEENENLQGQLDSIYGCVDETACNFDLNAMLPDNSCEYPEIGFNCFGNEIQYEIGELALGGMIFYLDSTGQHGLVSEIQDIGAFEWGCSQIEINGAEGEVIGTGYQNSLDIVNHDCITLNGGLKAAEATLNYESGGYSDWFLPSIDALIAMYNSIGPAGLYGDIGALNTTQGDFYWSSTEYNIANSWFFNANDGSYGASGKNSFYLVRPIRSF